MDFTWFYGIVITEGRSQFLIPVDATNFPNANGISLPMPNKRDPMSAAGGYGNDTLTYTLAKSWQASTRGLVENTFEVVDFKL